jgi:hypothetical protein
MLCFLYKWLISRSRDLGKELPGAVNRHMERCRDCRDFARLSKTLQQRLPSDASTLLRKPEDNRRESFKNRIFSALDSESFPAAHGRRTIDGRPVPKRRKRLPVPVLVPVMIVIGIVTASVVLVNPPSTIDPVNGGTSLLSRLTPPKVGNESFSKLVSPVESSIQAEMTQLGNSVKSAANHLLVCLSAGTRAIISPSTEIGRLP